MQVASATQAERHAIRPLPDGDSGTGGAGGTTSGNGGAGNSIPSRTGDPEDDGSCGCRIVGGDDSRSHAWLLLLGLAGFGVRRRVR